MITKTIQELYKIFDNLNKEFFEDKLIKPVILVQAKTKKHVLGTCTTNPVWLNKKDEQKDAKYEITLSGEYLNRELKEIVGTMIHEMVHLYCALNNLKDTSNNCVYHNKKFKEEAEKRGCIIQKAQTIGWSVTTLKPETEELIKKFNIDDTAFDYYRKAFLIEDPEKKKQVSHKYCCPKCGTKFSHYKKLNLICGNCNVNFEEKEEED
jgi:predicted transcriptional regulator